MKKTLRIIGIVILQICLSLAAYAQRHEIGLFGGTSYYLGDINPKKHFAMSKNAFGGIYRYNINPHWSIKFNGYHGTIESSDEKIKFNQKRNLSFRSPITEFALQFELHFFPYMTGSKSMIATPFIFAGLGFYQFNPQANYNDKWYDLQPLGTEGQGTTMYPTRLPYKLSGFSIPFGIGGKYSINRNMSVAVEWGLRKTFTDYLDDVSTTYPDPVALAAQNTPMSAILSDRTIWNDDETKNNTGMQRGDSSTNDWYAFSGVTITFRVFPKRQTCNMNKMKANKVKYQYN